MTQDQGSYYGPFLPPQKPEVGAPGGHGQAHAPRGGYAVEAQDLVNAAGAWDDVSKALSKAWNLTQEGWGYPGLFGMHDTLFTAGRLHMLANRIVVNACGDGAAITGLLADGLVETANDYSGTDTSQGTPFRTLERRAGE
ncbi:hypothetical protein [Nocardioides solisilvae]|uniref:hypothetical protein n=1 Tax=Nocardioides solisilvae TaxID=1542435 RepID=UPI000D745A5D|nr:hypothetical protein [Nocardioides solisilvae]